MEARLADRPQRYLLPDLCTPTAPSLVVLFAQLLVLVLWVAGDEVHTVVQLVVRVTEENSIAWKE